jgi:DNA mismatch endonuclease (patch repair protein)
MAVVQRPIPSSAEVSARLSRQRQRDTAPETALRRLLHASGLRYFVHVKPVAGLGREVDLVFPGKRLAVFVDGCFWHGCPDRHRSWPASNAEWWRSKINANRSRDLDTDQRLEMAGWRVIRIWEHEDVSIAAKRVRAALTRRTNT